MNADKIKTLLQKDVMHNYLIKIKQSTGIELKEMATDLKTSRNRLIGIILNEAVKTWRDKAKE
jgi:uncharacterized protein YbcI